jgi:hypothetical protein
MNFTANAAVTTAHAIAYSAKALTTAAATTAAASGAYTVAAGGGTRTVELSVTIDRRNARTHSLATSIPSAVDPLSTRANATYATAATNGKGGKRFAASQWDR